MSGDIARHAQGYRDTPTAHLIVRRALRNGAFIQTATDNGSKYAELSREYTYQGTGEDTLTVEPDAPVAAAPAALRQHRRELATQAVHDWLATHPLPVYVERTHIRMCPPCWEDACQDCVRHGCACPCQDIRKEAS